MHRHVLGLTSYNRVLPPPSQGDAKTERLKGVVTSKPGVWRDVATLSEAALAKQIREDKVATPCVCVCWEERWVLMLPIEP